MLVRAVSAVITLVVVLALLPSTVVAGVAHSSSVPVARSLQPDSAVAGGATTASRQLALGVARLPDSGAVYNDLSAVEAFKSQVGLYPAIWTIWRDWLPTPAPNTRFPGKALLDGLYKRSIVPMINWQPNDPTHLDPHSKGPCQATKNGCIPYVSITQGTFDGYIRRWANQAKTYSHPLIIRFAHEMDGDWMPWQVGKYGNSAKNFVAAWKHIVDIFRTVGATKVRFLWSPFDPVSWSVNFYPGDNYVDYVGFTGLNWADGLRRWKSMKELYAQPMHALAQFSKRPVIVAEAGTANRSLNGVSRKPSWITTGYSAVYAAYPKIAAIVYFDVIVAGQTQYDWRLNKPTTALAAYKSVVNQPKFQGRLGW